MQIRSGDTYVLAADYSRNTTEAVQYLYQDGAHILRVDLTNSDLRFRTVIANDERGGCERVSSMARRYNALAAINADYFPAGCTWPEGMTYVKGVDRTRSNWPAKEYRSSLAISRSNQVSIGIGESGREAFLYNVVGGGPTGIMAALTASTRGHRVTLFEKTNELGGQLLLAAKPPGKEKISWFRDYLLHQINQQGIKVEFGCPVTLETIVQEKPDVVILATGAIPLIPDLPGIKDQSVCTAWEILEGKKKVGDKMVLIVGGGTVGCETALYLAPNNKKVTIIEMLNDIALDMEFLNRMDLMSKIQEANIEVLLERKIV